MKLEEILEGITIEKRDWTDVFDVLEVIGRGNYGVVVKARVKETGEVVAVKQTLLEESIDVESGAREIRVLQSCHHPNIIAYHGTYRSPTALLVAMELCDGGSIDAVRKLLKRTFSEPIIAYVLHEMLCGLRYLHKEKKIHRDIKTGNILMNSKGEIKLADFGITAQLLHTFSRRNSYWGTMLYMAPEVLLETDYDEKADIWSLGITLLEITEGRLPFARLGHYPLLTRLTRKPPPTLQHPERFSKEFQAFVRRALQPDKYARPTAAALLDDPFLLHRDYHALQKEFAEIVQETIDRRQALGGFDMDGMEDEEDEEEEEEEEKLEATFVIQKDAPPGLDASSHGKEKGRPIGELPEMQDETAEKKATPGEKATGDDPQGWEVPGWMALLSTEDWSLDALQYAADHPCGMEDRHLVSLLTRQPLPSSMQGSPGSSSSSSMSVSSLDSSTSHLSSDFSSPCASMSSFTPPSLAGLPSFSGGTRTPSSFPSAAFFPIGKSQEGKMRGGDGAHGDHFHHGGVCPSSRKTANDDRTKPRKKMQSGMEYRPPQHLLHSTQVFHHLYTYYLQLPSMRSLKKQEVQNDVETHAKLEDVLGSMYHLCPTVKP